ncbi:MAG: xanthine dehydrogenase family protein molybdopterin-binding subunit [Lautropia sp.]|nr:xanthine dehydrogenase family protein molybdopterin-binding subunit [Lautropia sp.]
MSTDSIATRFGSGQAVRRLEDDALLRGKGKFTDDVIPEGQVCIQFLRSPYPHARIVSVNTAPARGLTGVIAVYSGADLVKAGVQPLPGVAGFPRPDGSPAVTPRRHPLAPDVARFVGDPIVAVVAQTREQARDALEAIVVDYEELPSVIDSAAALALGAPLVMPEIGDNVSAELRHGDAAATDQAFSRARHTASISIVNQRLAASPIEPRTVLAAFQPADGRLTVRLSSQMPTGARDTLGTVLGMGKDKIRVLVGDVGGGFGMKTGLYPEDAVVAYAARDLKMPVKWVADRSEELLSSVHGRDVCSDAELALDADGRILGLRIRSLANVGAYASGVGVAIQLLIGPWVTTSVYDITTIDLKLTAVMTNTATTGAYRGAGRPEAIYLIERLMDEAARVTGLSRTQIRRRNMIRPEQMPYRNPMAQTYDSGKFESVMNQGLALADWDGFEKRLAQSQSRGRWRGIGIATFLEWTGGNVFEERVTVRVAADGFIEIVSATQAMGQGIVTSYAQLAVDIFGVPIEKIRIVQGDTDLANGFGSAGSRSLFTGGSSVQVASQRTIEKAKPLAAEELEVSESDIEYQEGVFRVVGTDREVGLFELAARQPDTAIYVDSTSTVGGPTWPNGCHICEAEVDPLTGEVAVVSYASANDVGHVVNPMIVTGQLEGGAAQGIGQALCEQVVYDPESAQLVTGSFMDYAIPRADIVGPIATVLDQSTPCLLNPLGVKGVGELGTIGATPAVVSAVIDALSRAGHGEAARKLQMPLTGARVWGALNASA